MRPTRTRLSIRSLTAAAALSAVGCNENSLQSYGGTYLGKDFYAVDLDNYYSPDFPDGDASAAQYGVVVSNPHGNPAATVTITFAGETVDERRVEGGGLEIFELPRADVQGTGILDKAYHIKSTQPVTAHQFNPIGNVMVYSNDASLLLPSESLGTTYRALSWPQPVDGMLPGFVTVVAVEDGTTEVSVTVTAKTAAGNDIPAHFPGETMTATLQKGQVLNVETNEYLADLTGTLVTADKRIAVFGGTECSPVPLTYAACDHLEEQLIPVTTWGSTYAAAKSLARGFEPDLWRILAHEDGTEVTTEPPQPGGSGTLSAGQFLEFESTQDFLVHANKPVLVGQYLVGEMYNAGTGDPSMILIAPEEQYLDEYIFLTPTGYEFDSITVVARDGVEVTLDGEPLPESEWTDFGSGWRSLVHDVTDGTHHLKASAPVGLTVTGFDQYVSYGYPGGLNLAAH